MEDVDRFELYRYLMEDCDYGTAVEEMLRNLLTGMDPMAVRNALNEILEEDGFGVAQFKSKPDDPKKGKLYFGDEKINPYVASRTETDIYGEAAYNRLGQSESLELLKEEGECLKALFEKGA